jgi:hypothetical protein
VNDDTLYDDSVLDARVRRALQAVAAPDQVETLRALEQVQHAKWPRLRRPVPALAAAAALVLISLVTWRALPGDPEPEPAPAPGPELDGSWTRVVEAREEPSWSGRWTVTFGADRVLDLVPPARAAEVTDGTSYEVTGSQLRVDAFVNSVCYELPPGAYAWARDGGGLRITVIDDQCTARVELFTGVWGEVR